LKKKGKLPPLHKNSPTSQRGELDRIKNYGKAPAQPPAKNHLQKVKEDKYQYFMNAFKETSKPLNS
jgi:hypothetical protein